ncbi:MAG: sulfurtransferase [Candidatus Eremiobacteraeota bacterium]|nr:sulfurtransferase [Candidatus Eremiobacteraeota bacterium]
MAHTTLVDAKTVHDHLDDPSWVIVDCRHTLADFSLGRKLYEEAHIPGAFFADVEEDLAGTHTGSNGRHPLPDPMVFAAYIEQIGVNDKTQIVAYDAGGDMFAARLWFLCQWIGHQAAAVLDGGLAAWTAAGYELTAVPSASLHSGNVHVKLNNELVVDAAYVRDRLTRGMHLVDARAADRFRGENETIDPVAGHIPGARNRPFKENFDSTLHFRSPDDLRRAFAIFGEPSHVVHQCGSGVSAAANMLAMEVAGLHGSRLYAGSWSEWIADPSRPVTTTE